MPDEDISMKDLLKPLPHHVGLDNEMVLDKEAFKKYAHQEYQKSLSSKPKNKAEQDAYVQEYRKLVSGLAGVANLTQIEADFEVLNILRDSIPLDICEMRQLPLGELPLFRSKSINPVGITVGSLAGIGSTVYYATKQYGQRVQPFALKTVEGMIPNLNNIYDMQKIELRKDYLEREDWDMKISVNNAALNTVWANPSSVDVVLDDPATSLLNYFATGGSFAGKTVYTLDPGVQVTSVPSVNCYDLSSTETGLSKKVFQTIATHSNQIGRSFPKMYIPTAATSGHSPVWETLQNLATPVALVVGAGNASPASAIPEEMWSTFQQEDFTGEVIVNWFGIHVSIKKQNWMPPGYLVLFAPQPSAIMWDRLELTGGNYNEGLVESPVDGFYSRRSRTKQIATARPDYCLKNQLLIKVNA